MGERGAKRMGHHSRLLELLWDGLVMGVDCCDLLGVHCNLTAMSPFSPLTGLGNSCQVDPYHAPPSY